MTEFMETEGAGAPLTIWSRVEVMVLVVCCCARREVCVWTRDSRFESMGGELGLACERVGEKPWICPGWCVISFCFNGM